jgi:hypothetical protein
METPKLNDIASITAEFMLKRFDEFVEMRAKNKSWNPAREAYFQHSYGHDNTESRREKQHKEVFNA